MTISSDSFDTTSSPMLMTSAGAPEKHPAPSGTPGDPVILKRYDQLMAEIVQPAVVASRWLIGSTAPPSSSQLAWSAAVSEKRSAVSAAS